MMHGFYKGLWKPYADNMMKLLEKHGCKFTTFDEMMKNQGSDSPWDDYDYTIEEYYYNVVLSEEIIDSYQDNMGNFFAAVCFAAEYAFKGSAYSVVCDQETRSVAITEGNKTIAYTKVKDIETIEITMPVDIFNAINAYPEAIEIGYVKEINGSTTIGNEVLAEMVDIFLIIAGRAAELIDSCE